MLHGIFLALFVASAKVGLQIIPPVPFTLQTCAVILCGLVLGWQSVITVALYILLGLVGLPVFALGGGIGYALYPTFGFTLGFLLATPIVGLIYAKNRTVKNSIFAVIIGTLCIYVIGIGYYLLLQNFYFGKQVDFGKTLINFWVLFIPSDIIKGAICVITAKRIKPVLK